MQVEIFYFMDITCRNTSKPSQGLEAATYLLHVDFNVFLQTVAVQVQDQIVDKVEAVTDDDQRQLVGQFGFLRTEIQTICC